MFFTQPRSLTNVRSNLNLFSLARSLTHNLVFLESSNADIDELPNVIRQLSLVPKTPVRKDNIPSGSFFRAGSSHQASHFGTADLLSRQFLLRHVSKPLDFVEPRPSDIFLRGVLDPDSPSAPPRINPWSEDYFIGDVNIAV